MMQRYTSPDDAFAGAARTDAGAPSSNRAPLLKAPHWGWNVVTYLFLGGIMGGLGIVAALASNDDDETRALRRTARVASLALAAANPAILISHLGRPERFAHMLRVVNVKSPMSLGVWGLIAYSAAAGGSVVRSNAFLTALHALTGAFIAGYTGVLIAATANPLWSEGKRHIPAAFVCSGTGGACALMALVATLRGHHRTARRLERFETVAGICEAAVLIDFRERTASNALFGGKRGRHLRNATLIGGIAVPAALTIVAEVVRLPKALNAVRAVTSAVLALVGGYVLRASLIDAGKDAVLRPGAGSVQPW